MYTIAKTFYFSASHELKGLPEDHPCSRMHGHNYTVTVTLQSSTVNKTGFVRDYNELSLLKIWLEQHVDHRHLNDVMEGGINPTAENIAHWLYYVCKTLWDETYSVRVAETLFIWAEYAGMRR